MFKKFVHFVLKKILVIWYYLTIPTGIDRLYKKIYIRTLKLKSHVNVVFVVTLSSQWKYEKVYRLMKEDKRFNPVILLAPMRHYEQSNDYSLMRKHLDDNHIDYIDYLTMPERNKTIRNSLKPDILFYAQPYYHMYDKRVDSHSFKDKLICYAPYGFPTYDLEWGYDMEFHNRAWKVFHNGKINMELAKKYALNKGKNVELVGYLNADIYLTKTPVNVWKQQKKEKKKVIWAPHFSIFPDSALDQSNFISMAAFMLEIAHEFSDSIQFSFKPHPALLFQLYLHPDWGSQKAEDYYHAWECMENTQLDQGDFFDLFMTSDGMINDSGSFTAEYIYSKNPAINCFANIVKTKSNLSVVGLEALDVQYYGTSKEEIVDFLVNVILNGVDPKEQQRLSFYDKYLLPHNQKGVAQGIYDSIKMGLGME